MHERLLHNALPKTLRPLHTTQMLLSVGEASILGFIPKKKLLVAITAAASKK